MAQPNTLISWAEAIDATVASFVYVSVPVTASCYWGHRSESAIRQAKQRDSISRKYRRHQIQAVMSGRGVAHLTTARGTSSEEATINRNSLEVPLHLPQIHTSQTGQIKNKKPAKPCAIAGLCFLRTGMDRYLVPGTGLEPASQLRRRIFVTLLLSKPTSSERHRSCAGLCLRRRARACCVPVRLRRPPSSLYTFLAVSARLGSALPRCAHQGFRRI